MEKLTVEEIGKTGGMRTMKVTGFQDGELNELKSMEHHEAREKVMEMLDSRNDGLGNRLVCGYGVYGLWFDNEAVYFNAGTSCD